jgi:hypothetical protein
MAIDYLKSFKNFDFKFNEHSNDVAYQSVDGRFINW